MLIYYVVIVVVLILAAVAQQLDTKTLGVGVPQAISDVLTSRESYQHSPAARNTFILLAAIPTLVAGLRFRVGSDYGAYYYFWDDYANKFWTALFQLDEPGYSCIAFLTQQIGCKTGALTIFLASLITIGMGYWTIYRNSPQLFCPAVLFLFLGNWLGSFNAVRQCLAATMVFCGYPFLRNRKLWLYALMCFAAYLFHRSSILMFVPFFFLHCKTNLRNVLFVFLGSILVLNSYEYLFELTGQIMYKEYQLSNEDTNILAEVNRLRVMANIAPAVFFLALHFSKKLTFDFDDFALNILVLNASVSIVGMNSRYISRFILYTHPFMVLALPELCMKLPLDKCKMVVGVLISVYIIMTLYECSNSIALNNYQWIWMAF